MHLFATFFRAIFRELALFGKTAKSQIAGGRGSKSTYLHRVYCPEHGWVYHWVN